MNPVDGLQGGVKAAVAEALADGNVTEAEFKELQARYDTAVGLGRVAVDTWLADYPELHAALRFAEGSANEDSTGLA